MLADAHTVCATCRFAFFIAIKKKGDRGVNSTETAAVNELSINLLSVSVSLYMLLNILFFQTENSLLPLINKSHFIILWSSVVLSSFCELPMSTKVIAITWVMCNFTRLQLLMTQAVFQTSACVWLQVFCNSTVTKQRPGKLPAAGVSLSYLSYLILILRLLLPIKYNIYKSGAVNVAEAKICNFITDSLFHHHVIF